MATPVNINEVTSEPIPDRGIMSRTLLKNDHTSLVFMQLAPDEELNEHTSKFPVWIQTIEGRGTLKTSSGNYPMSPGSWIYLEPKEEHAVLPDTTLQFVLVLMK